MSRYRYALVSVTERAAYRKLTLKLERDLLTQKHFRALLADVDQAIVSRRRELRDLKAQMTSRSK
jgi:hypothetical protein